jgi:hypothetical protein
MFKEFFHKLPGNLAACFSGINLLWLLLAIAMTYVLVTSGFDWWYYQITRSPKLNGLALAAGGAGFVIPVAVPIGMYLVGRRRANVALVRRLCRDGRARPCDPQQNRSDRGVPVCVLHRGRRLHRLPLVLGCGGRRYRGFADWRGGRQIFSEPGMTAEPALR